MNFFKGRADRKTYIIGMGLILIITVALMLAFLIPLAAIELVVPAFRDGGPAFIDRLVLIVPTLFLVISSFSLLIRRAHDIGSDGLVWLVALAIALAARVLLDSGIAGLLPMLVLGALAIIPGNLKANRYGRKPPKKFTAKHIYEG